MYSFSYYLFSLMLSEVFPINFTFLSWGMPVVYLMMFLVIIIYSVSLLML